MLGIRSAAAARFSFLLSIPAVAGAVLLEVPALVRDVEAALDRAATGETGKSAPSRAWQVVLFALGLALGLALR